MGNPGFLTLWSTGIPIGNAARMLSVANVNVCMTIEMSDKRLVRSNDCFIEVCLKIETPFVNSKRHRQELPKVYDL